MFQLYIQHITKMLDHLTVCLVFIINDTNKCHLSKLKDFEET